ncbi:MAG: hypothetical protein KDC73_08595 [Ignavibacteriae bacterium]|nr:hypothetical protein [Ignavibacteriota bacterium]MCB9242234.1 hypothetical protein [Ignavibacteriales bacterium]
MTETTRSLNITPEEIESGKTMAVVAYIIFFVPLLMEDARKNKFVMFHTEQSIVLVIVNVIGVILGTIGSMFCIGVVFYLINLFAFVLAIMGIINAINGKATPLPLVGQFGEKFNLVK